MINLIKSNRIEPQKLLEWIPLHCDALVVLIAHIPTEPWCWFQPGFRYLAKRVNCLSTAVIALCNIRNVCCPRLQLLVLTLAFSSCQPIGWTTVRGRQLKRSKAFGTTEVQRASWNATPLDTTNENDHLTDRKPPFCKHSCICQHPFCLISFAHYLPCGLLFQLSISITLFPLTLVFVFSTLCCPSTIYFSSCRFRTQHLQHSLLFVPQDSSTFLVSAPRNLVEDRDCFSNPKLWKPNLSWWDLEVETSLSRQYSTKCLWLLKN